MTVEIITNLFLVTMFNQKQVSKLFDRFYYQKELTIEKSSKKEKGS